MYLFKGHLWLDLRITYKIPNEITLYCSVLDINGDYVDRSRFPRTNRLVFSLHICWDVRILLRNRWRLRWRRFMRAGSLILSCDDDYRNRSSISVDILRTCHRNVDIILLDISRRNRRNMVVMINQ